MLEFARLLLLPPAVAEEGASLHIASHDLRVEF